MIRLCGRGPVLHVQHAQPRAQIEHDVNQGVEIGDRTAVAKLRLLDAKGDGLAKETFTGGALAVEFLVRGAVAVKLVTDASAIGNRKGDTTAPLAPALVLDGTGRISWCLT